MAVTKLSTRSAAVCASHYTRADYAARRGPSRLSEPIADSERLIAVPDARVAARRSSYSARLPRARAAGGRSARKAMRGRARPVCSWLREAEDDGERPLARRHRLGRAAALAGRSSAGEEVEQGRVDHVGVGPGDVVRAALDGDEREILDQRGQPGGGGRIRQDPVGVPVDEQSRDVDLGQVGAEVGEPGVHAGPGGVGRGADGYNEAVL